MSAIDNKRIVTSALDELFGARQIAAIDRYFAEGYLQHNPFVAGGAAGLKQFARDAIIDNEHFSASRSVVIADGDRVAVLSRYTGFGADALVGFDVFRIEDERLAEHWDCLQNESQSEVPPAASTPIEAVDGPATEANRRLVAAFCEELVLTAEGNRAARLACAAAVSDAVERSSQDPERRRYQRTYQTIAEGNWVLVMSEGQAWGKPHVFYDLFDVRQGQVCGLWRVAQAIPQVSVGGLGML